MSVENENIEPVTELGLSLSYSSQSIQRRLNSATGAGANAGTRLDIEFAATDSLSELVWSPQNGPSLKCADYGFGDKRPPLLWGAEPSNVVLSPSKDITAGRSRTDKPIIVENFITSRSAFHGMSEMASKDTSTRTPKIDVAVMPICGSSHEDRTGTRSGEEMNNVAGTSVQHINEIYDFSNRKGGRVFDPIDIERAEISGAKENKFSSFPDELGSDFAQYEISSRNPAGGGIEVGSGKETSRLETVLDSEAHRTKECESSKSLMQNLTSPGRRHEKSASFLENESKNKKTIINSLLDKLESTSENDLQTFIGKNARGATSKIVASESSHEVKNSSRRGEQMLPKDQMTSGNDSPSNSRILRYRRKGKEKALSDGDFNGRKSKEDDESHESHESVESCNSTRLFSTGKKRCSFEQQLIGGSKKAKTQINESPGSASFIKHDSSFMTWISNMMKGFAKSNEDEAPPSLALTLAHPDHGHESHDQNIITYRKNQDYGCKNVGFQSIFQSLYCPKMKEVQDKTMDGGYQQELELGNRLCDISATPIACHGDNDNLCKQFLLSNEKYNMSRSANEASKSTQPKISSAKVSSSQENSKANSAENKNSCNLAMDSSMDKHKTSSTGKIDSEPPSSEVKISDDFGHGSNPLGSLWIARFIPKTSIPLMNFECQYKSSIGRVLESSTNFQRLFPSSQNPVGSSNDLKNVDVEPQSTEDPPVVVGKELQICAAETEACVGFNRKKCQNYQKLIHKLNPILPSSRLKNSEAMASHFARRLDALKHIVPSNVTDNAACATITCFFCGRKGHHLRDCSEITDGELEDLRRNINSYNGAEGLPYLCIRCYQLDHWAVACPHATSRDRNQSEYGASLGDHSTPNEMQLDKRNSGSTKLLDSNKSLLQAAGSTHSVHEISWKMNDGATSTRMAYDANPVKDYIASSSGENKLKDSQSTLSCKFVCRQISEAPKGIFEFIKKLRLSRTDILKWHMSLEHLNGFYLRLRLGKWEEGLGGTGYYVACITGARIESSSKNSKHLISVNVGGIKCTVESQYISNHDFLEDELMAWWSATAKSGSKIPSEEDLILKMNERKMLGL
ncbi:hypothetical protein Ddye_022386 [Dipteronia dyeriana]|uniref:CCHC-type domain-containing protein n=1 Tax=Dipteronia dyeriana TaxID=168575 RepID=A0AAD9WXS5_9ROSI|nr:hypothetical protein Ddye_022386 [Dipteronia dyeriana]